MLIEYIRKGGNKKFVTINGRKKRSNRRGGKRIGVMVSIKDEHKKVKAGWSLCMGRDKFDSRFGIKVAVGRANAGAGNIPHSITKKFTRFTDRAVSYYNGG